MCEYCKSDSSYNNKNMTEHRSSEITISKSELEIQYDEAFGFSSMCYYDSIKINYCPMCGEKLL